MIAGGNDILINAYRAAFGSVMDEAHRAEETATQQQKALTGFGDGPLLRTLAELFQTDVIQDAGKGAAAGSCIFCSCGGDAVSGSKDGGNPSDGAVPLKNIRQIAAGESHICALLGDGGVLCWGSNGEGQRGDGTRNFHDQPTPVIGLNHARFISLSGDHSCAIAEGSVYCWGTNMYGESNPASSLDNVLEPAPITFPDGSENPVRVFASNSCALLSDAAVECWGQRLWPSSASAACSENSPTDHAPSPDPLLSGITQMTSGVGYICTLTDGHASCWGANEHGQLGLGTDDCVCPPGVPPPFDPMAVCSATVPLSGIIKLVAGLFHTCALVSDGTVWCWGNNANGEVGRLISPDTDHINSPLKVPGLDGAVDIAAGWYHSCAVVQGGDVKCWGANSNGQIGNGSSDRGNVSLPSSVVGLTDVVQLALGFANSCALKNDGTVWCWGYKGDRRIHPSPEQVVSDY